MRHSAHGVRGGRNAFEHELATLGVTQKNGRGNHPQTQGKVERFQQTLKNWLRRQPTQPATIKQLQTLLDQFKYEYNHQRPHRALNRRTPAAAYQARPEAAPSDEPTPESALTRSTKTPSPFATPGGCSTSASAAPLTAIPPSSRVPTIAATSRGDLDGGLNLLGDRGP